MDSKALVKRIVQKRLEQPAERITAIHDRAKNGDRQAAVTWAQVVNLLALARLRQWGDQGVSVGDSEIMRLIDKRAHMLRGDYGQ